jgi:hypothetical protein
MNGPFHKHAETSSAAAAAIFPVAGTLRGLVLASLRERGAMTDEEMQDILAMNPNTQRPRRIELVEALLVRDSGQRRPTRSGRMAVVWEVREP